MTDSETLQMIRDVISTTEKKVDGVFEESPILNSSIREKGYLQIVLLLKGES